MMETGGGFGRGTGRGRRFPALPALKPALPPLKDVLVGGSKVVRGANIGVRIPEVAAGGLGAGVEPRGALACAPPAEWPPPKPPPACAPPPCCASATGACRHTATSKQTIPTRIFKPKLRSSVLLV